MKKRPFSPAHSPSSFDSVIESFTPQPTQWEAYLKKLVPQKELYKLKTPIREVIRPADKTGEYFFVDCFYTNATDEIQRLTYTVTKDQINIL